MLITANRNKHGPDSLEEQIRTDRQPTDLPIMTLANAERVLEDSAYAERTAIKLLDYLMRINQLLGTGRLYIP